MDHKLCILLSVLLFAGSGHGHRPLRDAFSASYADVDDRKVVVSSKTAAATDNEVMNTSSDYEMISKVEFEPELGQSYAEEPVPPPVAGAAIVSRKWWLPPSTMPSFPLFPMNPGMGMQPVDPLMPMPGSMQMPTVPDTYMPATPDTFVWRAPPAGRDRAPPSPAGSKDSYESKLRGGD